ncbi:MAG: hypothetical protein INR66_13250 [Gordonia polyisoprenivorans]|nr:hypothetical protein [Gordonia polyisoprenivorans]
MIQPTDEYMLAMVRAAEERDRIAVIPLLNAWLASSRDRPNWSREQGVSAFRAVGYTSDGYSSVPRRQPILFRGATFDYRAGFSWITHYSLAEWFATIRSGRVWVLYDVPALRVLARIGPDFADRQAGGAIEFVCDAADTKIVAL